MELYKLFCSFIIGSLEITYPPFTLEFEIEASINVPAQAKATIYNPGDNIIGASQKKGNSYPTIIINAGYEDYNGTCFTGEVIKYKIEKKFPDTVLELTLADKSSIWSYAIINKSWNSYITADQVANQIFKDFGLTPEIQFGNNKAYEKGISFSGVTLLAAMQRLAQDTNSSFSFVNGKPLFLSNQAKIGSAILLSYNSGLLEIVRTDKGLSVRTLLIHSLQPGGLVEIATNELQGTYKITKSKQYFSHTDAHCECEVIAI